MDWEKAIRKHLNEVETSWQGVKKKA